MTRGDDYRVAKGTTSPASGGSRLAPTRPQRSPCTTTSRSRCSKRLGRSAEACRTTLPSPASTTIRWPAPYRCRSRPLPSHVTGSGGPQHGDARRIRGNAPRWRDRAPDPARDPRVQRRPGDARIGARLRRHVLTRGCPVVKMMLLRFWSGLDRRGRRRARPGRMEELPLVVAPAPRRTRVASVPR